MFKVVIELDYEKIFSDRKYSSGAINSAVDKMFREYVKNVQHASQGVYTASDEGSNFVNMWSVIRGLKKQDWFRPYVKKWDLFNKTNSSNENPEGREDLMDLLKSE